MKMLDCCAKLIKDCSIALVLRLLECPSWAFTQYTSPDFTYFIAFSECKSTGKQEDRQVLF